MTVQRECCDSVSHPDEDRTKWKFRSFRIAVCPRATTKRRNQRCVICFALVTFVSPLDIHMCHTVENLFTGFIPNCARPIILCRVYKIIVWYAVNTRSYDTHNNVPMKRPCETLRILQMYNIRFVGSTTTISPPSRARRSWMSDKAASITFPLWGNNTNERMYLERYDNARLTRSVQAPRERNTSSFLSGEVYESHFHDRDANERSPRVPGAVGGFWLCPATTLITTYAARLSWPSWRVRRRCSSFR